MDTVKHRITECERGKTLQQKDEDKPNTTKQERESITKGTSTQKMGYQLNVWRKGKEEGVGD